MLLALFSLVFIKYKENEIEKKLTSNKYRFHTERDGRDIYIYIY